MSIVGSLTRVVVVVVVDMGRERHVALAVRFGYRGFHAVELSMFTYLLTYLLINQNKASPPMMGMLKSARLSVQCSACFIKLFVFDFRSYISWTTTTCCKLTCFPFAFQARTIDSIITPTFKQFLFKFCFEDRLVTACEKSTSFRFMTLVHNFRFFMFFCYNILLAVEKFSYISLIFYTYSVFFSCIQVIIYRLKKAF